MIIEYMRNNRIIETYECSSMRIQTLTDGRHSYKRLCLLNEDGYDEHRLILNDMYSYAVRDNTDEELILRVQQLSSLMCQYFDKFYHEKKKTSEQELASTISSDGMLVLDKVLERLMVEAHDKY